MDIRIVSAQQRIESLQAKAKLEPVKSDAELQAQIARLLCVLSSGLIEQATILIMDGYSQRRSHPNVARYVSNTLSKLSNAKFEVILIMLGRFDPWWRGHFEDNTAPEVRDAIDSIVNNKNQIAHGGQVGISLAAFTEYYKRVKSFILDLDAFVSVQ